MLWYIIYLYCDKEINWVVKNIEEIIMLKREFEKIRKKGYIKGVCNGLPSIGRTFETELNLMENEFGVPDYYGIEIKTRRAYSKNFITLFNAVPDGEDLFEVERLKNRFGYPYKNDRKYKVLYAEVFGNEMKFAGLYYQYKLDVDRNDKRVYLCIYNRSSKLIERKVYWSFEYLEERLNLKLKKLAIVNAWPRKIDGNDYFKYYKIDFFGLRGFDRFLDLLENGTIKLIIKVGIYLDEKNYGKTYDHGCGFSISESNICELFFKIFV